MQYAASAQQCGRELPSATLYHAPTIAQMARLLERPRASAILALRRGETWQREAAHLIVHALAGTVPFFELARDMAAEGHSDYGIQAKGVDGLEEPFDRGEDLAAFYLRSLRDIQPHGPYLLVGYCFEGLVAPGNGAQPTTRRIPLQCGPG
jgi:hypothetical protein